MGQTGLMGHFTQLYLQLLTSIWLCQPLHRAVIWVGNLIITTFIVCCDESQDVFVPKHDCLVDLGLSEPGALLSG